MTTNASEQKPKAETQEEAYREAWDNWIAARGAYEEAKASYEEAQGAYLEAWNVMAVARIHKVIP